MLIKKQETPVTHHRNVTGNIQHCTQQIPPKKSSRYSYSESSSSPVATGAASLALISLTLASFADAAGGAFLSAPLASSSSLPVSETSSSSSSSGSSSSSLSSFDCLAVLARFLGASHKPSETAQLHFGITLTRGFRLDPRLLVVFIVVRSFRSLRLIISAADMSSATAFQITTWKEKEPFGGNQVHLNSDQRLNVVGDRALRG